MAFLRIVSSPSISDSETTKDLSIMENENARITCVANGKPAPSITWKINGNIKGLYQVAQVEYELKSKLSKVPRSLRDGILKDKRYQYHQPKLLKQRRNLFRPEYQSKVLRKRDILSKTKRKCGYLAGNK